MILEHRYHKLLEHVAMLAQQCGRDPKEIQVVAVSKQHHVEEVRSVYAAGCRDFGENRLQEVLEKQQLLPQDIVWHFIGTLQTNKVRKAIGKFALIHSVDTPELAAKISFCSIEAGMVSSILLQMNTSGEKSKHGLSPEEWHSAIEELIYLKGIKICGLMTMAPLTDDQEIIRRCFSTLRNTRDHLQRSYQIDLPHLSMGMSHDYPIAIAEGATLLRIGRAIFFDA